MIGKLTLPGLQRGILLFWALWFLIVCVMNIFDLLVTIQLLPFDWPAVSDNHLLIEKATSIYYFPRWINNLFFVIIIAWLAICSILFFRAFFLFPSLPDSDHSILYEAFGVAIALFCSFLLACVIFIVYDIEAVHFRVFIALLLSLLVIRLPR